MHLEGQVDGDEDVDMDLEDEEGRGMRSRIPATYHLNSLFRHPIASDPEENADEDEWMVKRRQEHQDTFAEHPEDPDQAQLTTR